MTEAELDLDALWSARLALDERGGPALRLPKDRALSMVDHALAQGLVTGALTAAPDLRNTSAQKRARSFGWTASAAVVLLALSGGVFAALRHWAEAAPKAQPAASRTHRPTAPQPPSAALRAPEAEPGVPAPSEAPSAARPEPRRVPHAEPASPQEPDDLLQAANRLRGQGRFEAAADVYALVYERHPSSIAAYTAEVARATIELEHRGNARYARTLFMRALRRHPDGALDIEVRQGLALALHDLGDTVGEARALAELIAAHPESPAAERARVRELAGRAR